jgi:hypothetical protein
MTSNKQNTQSIWSNIQKMLREVLIIIFGVTISIWFANWNDKRKEREEVKTFLVDLREDLIEDTVSMNRRIELLKPNIQKYRFAINLTNTQLDSITKAKGSVKFNFDIIPLQFNNGNYQGFKSSGKIGYIDNKELKKQILLYYEQAIPSLKEVEIEYLAYQKALRNIFYDDEYSIKQKERQFFLDPKTKTGINNAILFSNIIIQMSEISIQQADTLLLSIDKALK